MSDSTSIQAKASPKDIFLQLISIIALYGSVIALLTLLFQMINILIPDAIANYYNSYRYNGTARGAIAALIVFFPMFLWTVRTLAVEYKIDESRKRLSIRKWLLHFTLFIAALVIATDFITLIYNFLNGDLTLKFTLKIFSVLIVALLVFWYYRNEIKETTKEITRYVGYIVSIFVLIAIVGGIFVTGSPFEARKRKIDDQRVSDLSMIQSSVIEYWQNKGELPENLSQLNDNLRGILIPKDPETNKEYGYGTKGNETFVLCAIFATTSDGGRDDYYLGGFRGNTSWKHDRGQVCFDRTIDKDFFKQNNVGIKPVF
ncbi:hypothetical protein C4565_07475 [Candidatus Parcubacteria bacterium]|jgi:hypothetical protein|nr:MAG: hypothetical protein C4565_07475 [Candidatus Parcubacteria bacterium]